MGCVCRAPLIVRVRLLGESKQLLHRQRAVRHLRLLAAREAGHGHDARLRLLEVLAECARGPGRTVHEDGVVVAAEVSGCERARVRGMEWGRGSGAM